MLTEMSDRLSWIREGKFGRQGHTNRLSRGRAEWPDRERLQTGRLIQLEFDLDERGRPLGAADFQGNLTGRVEPHGLGAQAIGGGVRQERQPCLRQV